MDFPISEWYEHIQETQYTINLVIFSSLIAIDLLVLIFVRFNVDLWGFLTLIIHLIVSSIRYFTPKFYTNPDVDLDENDPPTVIFD
jgi:hypothetical protein